MLSFQPNRQKQVEETHEFGKKEFEKLWDRFLHPKKMRKREEEEDKNLRIKNGIFLQALRF